MRWLHRYFRLGAHAWIIHPATGRLRRIVCRECGLRLNRRTKAGKAEAEAVLRAAGTPPIGTDFVGPAIDDDAMPF